MCQIISPLDCVKKQKLPLGVKSYTVQPRICASGQLVVFDTEIEFYGYYPIVKTYNNIEDFYKKYGIEP